eukprot:TRINITY_DN4349_c7_g1_i1.p1 TRINITY_DN4349_c7_g1~~TRINITY_DN4349_c7_g1_i1.p1  ORF type:complete len:354 (+),score=71.91 TRINITY_DN4349_c7_g1_i1:56-1063(+)
MDIDNATAFEMAKAFGTILVLDFPVKGHFGVDLKSWTTGERFKGVKMLPMGPHLITYCLEGEGGVGGAVCSFFINIAKKGEVFVYKWDVDTETLIEIDELEREGYENGVRSMAFDQSLAPYPFEIHNDWMGLMGPTRIEDIDRIRPVSKQHFKSSTLPESGGSAVAHSGLSCSLFFTSEPERPKDLTPSDVTQWCFDGSLKLDVLSAKIGSEALASELSVAFILFLVGQSYEGFEHWKSLLGIFLTAEASLSSPRYTAFYIAVSRLLTAQLGHVPEEFFVVDKGFLPAAFTSFKQILPATLPSELQAATSLLMEKAESLMGVLEDDEDDMPVIVE